MDQTVKLEANLEKPVQKKVRSSGLELFRIISMFLIVAHHYVVNSDVILMALATPTKVNSILFLIIGAWGKTGINCFVLITGYFMCKSSISLRKFLKLIFEIEFYRIVIYFIFLLSGYVPFSVTDLIKALLPVTSVESNFTGCFLLFYLCIPFLSILVRNMTERMHLRLVILVSFIYIILGTVPKMGVTMNYVSWFIVLFVIASYISLYPKKIFDSAKIWGIISILMLIISVLSIVVAALLTDKLGTNLSYYLLSDSNKILAVCCGLSWFLFFKNLNIGTIKFINLVGASTFGVLLIHANSDAMRRWLWKDVVKTHEQFASSYGVLLCLASVIIIFAICTVIDLLRIKFIEKPFFKLWDKHEKKLVDKYKKTEDKICEKFNIGE